MLVMMNISVIIMKGNYEKHIIFTYWYSKTLIPNSVDLFTI